MSTNIRCSTVDYLPTIVSVVGYTFSSKDNRPIDGIDIMPVINGSKNRREKPLFFGYRHLHQGIDGQALISGNYKIFREAKKMAAPASTTSQTIPLRKTTPPVSNPSG